MFSVITLFSVDPVALDELVDVREAIAAAHERHGAIEASTHFGSDLSGGAGAGAFDDRLGGHRRVVVVGIDRFSDRSAFIALRARIDADLETGVLERRLAALRETGGLELWRGEFFDAGDRRRAAG